MQLQDVEGDDFGLALMVRCSLICWKMSWKIVRTLKAEKTLAEVESSVGRALSFSHEGPWFKSWCGHLFVSLLICELIDCKTDEH